MKKIMIAFQPTYSKMVDIPIYTKYFCVFFRPLNCFLKSKPHILFLKFSTTYLILSAKPRRLSKGSLDVVNDSLEGDLFNLSRK